MEYSSDIDYILAKRFDNGADFWATPEGSLVKGGPFSTLEAAYNLAALGLPTEHPALAGACDLIWQAQRKDGGSPAPDVDDARLALAIRNAIAEHLAG